MKLSELVAYRNDLSRLSAITAWDRASQDLAIIEHVAGTGDHTQQFTAHNQTIQSAFLNYQNILDNLRRSVQAQIDHEEKYWFQESYRLYSEEMVHENPEYILDRRMILRPETQDILQARLRSYNDWRQPGMIIRPGCEPWIHDLVSLDPLYILDQDLVLLEPVLTNFNEVYQRRLRKYLINEHSDDPILKRMPDAQIGLCLAYNYFNFRPIEVIKRYLQEVFTKLKPGGVLIMTINDCDHAKAVMLVEQHFCCYTPGQLIKDLAVGLGYEPVFEYNDGGPSTWMEFKKPGSVLSLKGGQALAKIVPKQ